MQTGAVGNLVTAKFQQFFSHTLPLDDLPGKSLSYHTHRRTLRRGDRIIAQGDPSAYVFFIEEGNILVYRSSEAGKEVALSYLGPGDACGLEDALSGQPYCCMYQAISSGVVWCVLVDDLRVLIGEFPALAHVVIRYMADRMRSGVEHFELVTLEALSTRVRKVLAQCAARADTANGSVRLPLTQSQLAALVGASRQRINAVLVDLHRMGVVESQGRGVVLRDPRVCCK
jgi:CRP/FNR family transcriptional regulator, cyclic AMP receptor protein